MYLCLYSVGYGCASGDPFSRHATHTWRISCFEGNVSLMAYHSTTVLHPHRPSPYLHYAAQHDACTVEASYCERPGRSERPIPITTRLSRPIPGPSRHTIPRPVPRLDRAPQPALAATTHPYPADLHTCLCERLHTCRDGYLNTCPHTCPDDCLHTCVHACLYTCLYTCL